jgi:hypothetical protein
MGGRQSRLDVLRLSSHAIAQACRKRQSLASIEGAGTNAEKEQKAEKE